MSKRQQRSQYVDYGGTTDKYTWDQWEDELIVSVKLGGSEISSKDVVCEIKGGHLKVGLKGKPPVIDGDLHKRVLPDESTWTIENGVVEITMQKATPSDKQPWWSCVIVGDPGIDVKDIEGAKYLDDSLLKKIKEKREEEKRAKELAAKSGENGEAAKTEEEKKTEENPAPST